MSLRINEEEAGRWADEHYLEQLKSRLGKLEREKESYFASKEGSHPQVRKIDQQISEIKKEIKRMTQDDDPKSELIKYAEATKDPDYIKHVKEMKNQASINARLQWHRQKENKVKDSQELEAAQELFSAFKSKLTDEKTYQNGEHVKVINKNNGEKMELKVLKDNQDGTLEVKAPTGAQLTIKKSWIVDNDLGALFKDAYDPAKYEGTTGHRKNLWSLENSLESFRGRAKTSKERIAKLRNMVSSGKYGSATARELKEEEREYENILMKIQQVRSMLQRMKGQKDSCATKDGYDFGDETMTTKEAKEYWDKYHNSDPVLKGYKTFEAWYRESKMNGYIKDGYNWEEPKVIEAKIKELEEDIKKGKFVDPNYLAGIKRALEMAKRERATKDSDPNHWTEWYKYFMSAPKARLEKIKTKEDAQNFLRERGLTLVNSNPALEAINRYLITLHDNDTLDECMEVLRLSGITQDAGTYPVVHREGDFKVVQTNEGFEVYYLGIYYDTFHTKEKALGFINKFNERAKARNKDASPYQIGDVVWVRIGKEEYKAKILEINEFKGMAKFYVEGTGGSIYWGHLKQIRGKA